MLPDDSPRNPSVNAALGATSFPIGGNVDAIYNSADDRRQIIENFVALHREAKWTAKKKEAEEKHLLPPAPLKKEVASKHVIICGDSKCTVRGCQPAKLLYEHWMMCEKNECNLICAPVATHVLYKFLCNIRSRQLTGAQHELQQYLRAHSDEPPLKNVKGIFSELWED
ncbi:hypothetical protein Ocin01_02739 [Orchesella cincta]|uniref:TAZ-type domain-containing protein n=1 Tax=Orchesella cincta TaxID=48709 RepID=A0A1D2NF83_ORCCI|nr:hypothetical protein Ocin01_02739 [Orchesella cincta]